MTDTCVTPALLDELSGYCDEYLIHAVDVEGKCHGIAQLKELGRSKINVTIGSALDLFGGSMKLDEVLKFIVQ